MPKIKMFINKTLLKLTILLLVFLTAADCYVKYQPEQIHLALAENGRDIVVTWSTPDRTHDAIVEYGIDKINMSASGHVRLFIDPGSILRPQEVHWVKLTNLKPNATYKYRCGGNLGWSPIFWFKTFPEGDDWSPHLALYGDLGNENAVSLPQLQKETQDGLYDTILHIGDFAYDMQMREGRYGDEFMRQIEPIAAYVPYMVSPGNHEMAFNFSQYKGRFNMPGDNRGLYYSYNIGPVHFISFSSEVYYYTYYLGPKRQYEWLAKDLEEATRPENRKKQPWIIVLAHRPMYCSNDNSDDCTNINTRTRVGLGSKLKYGLESLFYEYGVDLEIWAHEHSYERLFPIYNYTVYNGSYEEPYRNPNAPIHITTGSAGCDEKHDNFKSTRPDWCAFRTVDYGYTRLKVHNRTHLYFEQVSIDQSRVVDSFWVIKDYHGKYKKN